jgi:hypothetical protein
MSTLFGSFLLIAAGAFCLLTAWSAGTGPAAFAHRLGLAIASPGGGNEVRAQYAGFFFAVALACLAGLTGIAPRPAAYLVLTVVFGGLLLGRLVSLGADGGTSGYPPTIRALHAIDAARFLLSAAALLAG